MVVEPLGNRPETSPSSLTSDLYHPETNIEPQNQHTIRAMRCPIKEKAGCAGFHVFLWRVLGGSGGLSK